MTLAYSPWEHVAAYPDVLVVVEELDHARAYWEPDERVILLDRRLNQAERRWHLAHELAHVEAQDECCCYGPDGDRLGRRQERRADRVAATALIQLDQLVDTLRWALGPDEVAEHLHVPEKAVRARILALTPAERHYIEHRLATDPGAA